MLTLTFQALLIEKQMQSYQRVTIFLNGRIKQKQVMEVNYLDHLTQVLIMDTIFQ